MGIKNAKFVGYFVSIKIHEKSYLRKSEVKRELLTNITYCVQYWCIENVAGPLAVK